VVLFLHNTSRVEGEPYPDLLSEKGGTGFPYLVVLDAQGEVLAPHNGPRTVEAFAKTTSTSETYFELMKKYEAGDKAAAAGYLQAGLELGAISADRARELLASLEKISDAEREAIELKIMDAEFMSIIRSVRTIETAVAAGETLAAMIEAGFEPEGDQAINTWAMISYYATEKKNAELLSRAIAEFEKTDGNESFKRDNLQRMKSALEAMLKK